MKHRSIVWGIVLVVATCGATPSKAPATKQADIRKLMDMVGVSSLALQMAEIWTQSAFQALKAADPGVPERAAEVIQREVRDVMASRIEGPNGFTSQIIPIYDKHFTHQEIKDLMTFYGSPTGKKAIAVLPQVMSESAALGQKWGESMAPEMDQRIRAALRKENLIP
ncbi:MAG TPA: DUF2059 domain-containing protein [Candidatus Eisenbacteria bacterium]|nr:DUF2059 domain-containing protein [Candidatus Eisenbacteria bacterium]